MHGKQCLNPLQWRSVKLFGFLQIIFESQGPEKGTFILLLSLLLTWLHQESDTTLPFYPFYILTPFKSIPFPFNPLSILPFFHYTTIPFFPPSHSTTLPFYHHSILPPFHSNTFPFSLWSDTWFQLYVQMPGKLIQMKNRVCAHTHIHTHYTLKPHAWLA